MSEREVARAISEHILSWLSARKAQQDVEAKGDPEPVSDPIMDVRP